MYFTTIRSKVKRNSVCLHYIGVYYLSFPFSLSTMFFSNNESDMRWHAMFILKLPYVMVTLLSFFCAMDSISP